MIIACIKTNDNWFCREIKQVMKGKVQFPYEEQTWESAFRPRTGLQLYKSWKALKVWFYEPSPVRVFWRIQESFYLMLASRPDDRGDFPQWGVWRAGLGVGGARRQPLGQQQVKDPDSLSWRFLTFHQILNVNVLSLKEETSDLIKTLLLSLLCF